MNPRWRFGLLGENIAYTRSPQVFAAIAEYLNVVIGFEVADCPLSGVDSVVRRIATGELDGLSVTIPYKDHVCRLCNRLSDSARIIGAVNCAVKTDGGLVGHNTDWEGFLLTLKVHQIDLSNASVMILGSGGAARAVAYGLQKTRSVREFVVVLRSDDHKSQFITAAGNCPVRAIPYDDVGKVRELFRDSDLVVNATPLGGSHARDGGIMTSAFTDKCTGTYYDLNYNKDNALLLRAAHCGWKTIDGSAMLVAQALRSFELWTGLSVPFGPILAQAFKSENG